MAQTFGEKCLGAVAYLIAPSGILTVQTAGSDLLASFDDEFAKHFYRI